LTEWELLEQQVSALLLEPVLRAQAYLMILALARGCEQEDGDYDVTFP
jgi:hypothetical protein